MKAFLTNATQKLRTFLRRLYGLRMRPFPQTELEMNSFIKSTLDVGGLPETDSYRSLVAQAVLHASQNQIGLYPTLIVREIERAQANHLAYAIIDAVKKAEKAAKT
jgi:hypothetical protein